MDDFEGLRTSVEKGITNVIEIVRELELEKKNTRKQMKMKAGQFRNFGIQKR